MRRRMLGVLVLSALCLSCLSGCGASESATEPAQETSVETSATPDPPEASEVPVVEESLVTRENYDKVQKGMTIEEVREILGPEFLEKDPLDKGTDKEIRRYNWYSEPDGKGHEVMVSTEMADDGVMRVNIAKSDLPKN